MGALASGATAAVGTGAFSSASAERSITVNVADDSDGYLGLKSPHHFDSENYSRITEEGELELDFADNGEGDGPNVNATLRFKEVFRVANQGSKDIKVWFELDKNLDGVISFYPHMGVYDDDHDGLIGEDDAWSFNGHTTVGDAFSVGVEIVTTDVDVGEIEGEVTVHAASVE